MITIIAGISGLVKPEFLPLHSKSKYPVKYAFPVNNLTSPTTEGGFVEQGEYITEELPAMIPRFLPFNSGTVYTVKPVRLTFYLVKSPTE